KRILLMHISNISGHRSASLAIEKAIKFRSHQTETLTINLFNYVHPQGEWIVNFLYMLMIQRFPFVWGHLYDNPYWVKKTRRMKAMIHRQNLPKLESLFNNFRPDLAVSTQAFPCGMVADYKRIKGVNFPLIAVLTDFVPHWYWIYDTIDYYVAPSEEVKEKLITKGISSNRIKALGIPFDPKFNINLNKTELRKKLNLNEKLFTVLIMGGGQGLGPIKEVIKEIDNLEFPLQAIVVCGSNRRIYGWLKKRLKYYKKDIHLLGYAQNIEELMSVADIIITKPGGITCAEALSKGLPILVIAPIPGQEANNTDYLTKQGAAIEVKTPRDLIDIIGDLYRKPNKLKNLSEACLRIAKPNAAGDIAELLLNL
ncbi:MAG: glycosyltransferase, partial [Candidatus Omnitrophota bacterium]